MQNVPAWRVTMKSLKLKVLMPVIVLAVVCVCFSALGIISTTQIKNKSNTITKEHLDTMDKLDNMSEDFQEMQRLLLVHFIAGNDEQIEYAETSIDAVVKSIESDIKAYKSYAVSADDKKAYEEFAKLYSSYKEVYMKALKYSQDGDKGDATTMANGDVTTYADKMQTEVETLLENEDKSVDATVASQSSLLKKVMIMNIFMIILSLVLAVIAVVLCASTITRPVSRASRKLNRIIDKLNKNKCDLSERINVETEDEIGILVTGINSFLSVLQRVIGNISERSVELNEAMINISDSIAAANGNSCDISSVMEQLAASMQEVSTTTSNIDKEISGLDESAKAFAIATGNVLGYSETMQERAGSLSEVAQLNQDNTQKVIEQIMDNLKAAIEHSKSVEQVENLTNEILSISSKTNLLALNASIEAARAGEAGKGFAVVADEIRQLADSSRATANNIQKINESVVAAVNELSENSNKIVEYVDTTILKDYASFVDAGKQYKEDSIYINKHMSELASDTDSMRNIVRDLLESIGSITMVIEQSANGIETTAQNISGLSGELVKINSDTEVCGQAVEKLNAECSQFKTSEV